MHRMTSRYGYLLGIVGLFILSICLPHLAAAAPQQKGKDVKEAILQRELREARIELQKAEKIIQDLRQKNNQLQSQLKKEKNDPEDKKIQALQKEVAELKQKSVHLQDQQKKEKGQADKQVTALQSQVDNFTKAAYVHCVVFRIKSETPKSEVDALLKDVPELLGKIKVVRGIWAGPPASKATPEVAVKDYTVGLLVLLDGPEELQKYLDDPLHKKFADKHLKRWERPVVYDFQRK